MYSHIVEVVLLLILLFCIYRIFHTPISTFLLGANLQQKKFHDYYSICCYFSIPTSSHGVLILALVPQTLCTSLCIKDIFKMTPYLLSLIFTFVFHLKFTCFFEVPKTRTQIQKHQSMFGQFLKDHFTYTWPCLHKGLYLLHIVLKRERKGIFLQWW
jgi:hypothetical protein